MSSIDDIPSGDADDGVHKVPKVPKQWLGVTEFEFLPTQRITTPSGARCVQNQLELLTSAINNALDVYGTQISPYPPSVLVSNAVGQQFDCHEVCEGCSESCWIDGDAERQPKQCSQCNTVFCKQCLVEHNNDTTECQKFDSYPRRTLNVAIDLIVKQGTDQFIVQVWCKFKAKKFEVFTSLARKTAESKQSTSPVRVHYGFVFNINDLSVLFHDGPTASVLKLAPGTPLIVKYHDSKSCYRGSNEFNKTWVIVSLSFVEKDLENKTEKDKHMQFPVPAQSLQFWHPAQVQKTMESCPASERYDTEDINFVDEGRTYGAYWAIVTRWGKLLNILKTQDQAMWIVCRRQLQQQKAKHDITKQQLEENKALVANYEKSCDKQKKALKQQYLENQTKQAKIAEMMEILANVEAATKEKIDEMKSRMKEKLDEAQQRQNEFATAVNERAQAKIDKAKEQLDISLKKANDDIAAKNEEIARKQKEMTRKQEQMANTVAVIARKEADIARKEAELNKVADALSAELQAKDAQLQAKDAELQAKDAELQAKDAELQAKNEQIRRLAVDLEEAEHRCGQCFLHMLDATHMCRHIIIMSKMVVWS